MTGHVDTVALGDNVWSHPPFAGEIGDGKLYGLGSIDMKGAMGAAAVLFKKLAADGIVLKGDLSFESVVDEEEGGVNATIAGRLRYGKVDAALIPEGTELKIYPAAARGALITDFIFHSTKGTWLDVGRSAEKTADAVKQIGIFLTHLDELSAIRRPQPVHALYTSYPDPVPVQVTKVYAGGWGNQVPIAVPPEGRIELIMQTMPGETREEVEGQMLAWLDSVIARHEDDFVTRPEMRHRVRWMVPTAIDAGHDVVRTMAVAAEDVLEEIRRCWVRPMRATCSRCTRSSTSPASSSVRRAPTRTRPTSMWTWRASSPIGKRWPSSSWTGAGSKCKRIHRQDTKTRNTRGSFEEDHCQRKLESLAGVRWRCRPTRTHR